MQFVDDILCRNKNTSLFDLTVLLKQAIGGNKSCDVNKFVAVLKAQLQRWSTSGCTMGEQSSYCLRLSEVLLNLFVIDKSLSSSITDDHIKVVVFVASNLMKLGERGEIVSWLLLASNFVQSRSANNVTTELSKLVSHVIQNASNICVKGSLDDHLYFESILSITLVLLSPVLLNSISASLSEEQCVQLHQFQLDSFMTLITRPDFIFSNISSSFAAVALVGDVMKCYSTKRYAVKASKAIEMIHRQLIAYWGSTAEGKDKHIEIVLLQYYHDLLVALETQKCTIDDGEFVKSLTVALDVYSRIGSTVAFQTLHRIARPENSSLKSTKSSVIRFMQSMVDLIVQSAGFTDLANDQEDLGCLKWMNDVTYVDAMTKFPYCLTKKRLLEKDLTSRFIEYQYSGVIKILLSTVKSEELSNGLNKGVSSLLLSTINTIYRNFNNALQQTIASYKTSSSRCDYNKSIAVPAAIFIATEVISILSIPHCWFEARPMALSLLKGFGACLTMISIDDLHLLQNDQLVGLLKEIELLFASMHHYISDSEPIGFEIASCLFSITLFILPRAHSSDTYRESISLLAAFITFADHLVALKDNNHETLLGDPIIKFEPICKLLDMAQNAFISFLLRLASIENKSAESSSSDLELFFSLLVIISDTKFGCYTILHFISEMLSKLQESKVLQTIDEELTLDLVEKAISNVPKSILGDCEKDILCLEFMTNSLVTRGVTAADSKAKLLVDKLLSLSPIAAPQFKQSTSKSKKAQFQSQSQSQAKDEPLVSHHLHPVVELRRWMVLLKWAQPLHSLSRDEYLSFSSNSSSVDVLSVLSHAVKSVLGAVEWLSTQSNKGLLSMGAITCNSSIFLGTFFIKDCRNLFHTLGLYGRISDQMQLMIALERLQKHYFPATACGRQDDDLYSILSSIDDLRLLSALQHILLGEYTWINQSKGSRRLHPHFSSTVGAYLESLTSMLVSSDWNIPIMSSLKAAHFRLLTTGPNEKLHLSSDEYHRTCEAVLALIDSKPRSKSRDFSIDSGPRIIRAWYMILVAKIFLVTFADHKQSLAWAKRALSQTSALGIQRMSIEMVVPRLEALLIISEVYEQCGLVVNALSYLSEATALAKLGSAACVSIVSLHGLRMWYRLSSPRLTASVSDIIHCCDHVTSSSDLDTFDDVSRGVKFTVSRLAKLLDINIEDRLLNPGVHVDAFDQNISLEESLRFRFMSHYWNTSEQTSKRLSMSSLPSSNFQMDDGFPIALEKRRFDTCVHPSDRRLLLQIAAADHSNSYSNSNSNSNSNSVMNSAKVRALCSTNWRYSSSCSKSSHVSADLFEAAKSLNFEVSRSIRRLHCSKLIHSPDGGEASADCNHTFLSFLLGISSCNTSVENITLLETYTQPGQTSQHSKSLESLHHASLLIRDIDDQGHSFNQVQSLLHSLVSDCSHDNVSNLCFLAVDPFSTNFLLGRLDKHVVSTVSIAIGEQVVSFLQGWNALMEENNRVLRRTKDIKQLQKWTDQDKQQWWDDRNMCDDRICQRLEELESLLGPWRCLLLPHACIDIGDESEINRDIAKLFYCPDDDGEDASKERKPTRSKKCDKQKPLQVGNSYLGPIQSTQLSSIMSWLRLVVSAMMSKQTNRPLSRNEATEVLTHVLLQVNEQRREEVTNCCAISDELLTIGLKAFEVIEVIPSSAVADEIAATSAPIPADASPQFDEDIESLKITDLRKLLKSLDLSTSGKKDELIARLQASKQSPCRATSVDTADACKKPQREHTLLVLDENLQGIPVECMPCLKSISCSRVPGLAVLLSMIASQRPPYLYSSTSTYIADRSGVDQVSSRDEASEGSIFKHDIEKSWYIIDPESNLPTTRSTMMSFLDPFIQRWKWKGFASQMPPEAVVRSNHEASDVFIYCGHGAGEKLINSHKQSKSKTPSALLWGCSSGKLATLGVHDPYGPSLNYLLGGARFVVGNLWDVTDRDIDKYSMECMGKILPREDSADARTSIGHGISTSRDVCKLKYIVGCAPVMYGLPGDIVATDAKKSM